MEKLLTTKQVADRLNMHPKTLYRALRENTIALNYIQISPRRFGFRPADVEQYLGDREVVRTGDSPKKRKLPKRKTSTTGKGRPEFGYFTDKEAQSLWAQVRKPQGVFDRTEPVKKWRGVQNKAEMARFAKAFPTTCQLNAARAR